MSDIKLLRGQIRQIVKELLPEVLKEQMFIELQKHVSSRLVEVEKYMKDTADLMNTRQKETLKYLLETYLQAVKPEEKKEEVKTEEVKGE